MKAIVWLGALGLVCVAGCGDGHGLCAFTACGGSPVGEWHAVDACGTDTMNIDGCSGASVSADVDSLSGTVSVRADMTYSVNIMTSGSVHATIPGSCLPQGLTSCSQLADLISGSGISNPSCVGNPAMSCTCSGRVDGSSTEDGTWSVAGTQLTTTPNGSSTSSTANFCAQGNSLKIQTGNGAIMTLSK